MYSVQLSVSKGRIVVDVAVVMNARVIITTPSDKVLLVGTRYLTQKTKCGGAVRRVKRGRYDTVYNIPGGHITPYDLSTEGAALRELFEETRDAVGRNGYPIHDDMKFMGKFVHPLKKYGRGANMVVYWYQTSIEPKNAAYTICNNEIDLVTWVDITDLRNAVATKARKMPTLSLEVRQHQSTRLSGMSTLAIKKWMSMVRR